MIDIIIPCYNAKKTIKDTLYSIMYQNFDNYNVYLVNDAGKDNYEEEVMFFSKFFRITEIRLKENRGPGYARDYGMKHSYSDYIVFIDSDDVLANPNSLKFLYNSIKMSGDDFFVGAMSLNGIGFSSGHFGSLHGKIFRRSFIIENDLSFNYERYTSEDSSFIELLLIFGAKQSTSEYVTYILRNVNDDSIMHKTDDDKRLIDFVFQSIWAMEQGEKRPDIPKDYLKYLSNYMPLYYYFNCRHIKLSSDEVNKINNLKRFGSKYMYDDNKLKEEIVGQIKNLENKDKQYILFEPIYDRFKEKIFDKVNS